MPPDLRDWLDEDHLAWFVIEAIEELDLEGFYASYRSDGHGRAAHDPKIMLTLLAYAYAVGERSSKEESSAAAARTSPVCALGRDLGGDDLARRLSILADRLDCIANRVGIGRQRRQRVVQLKQSA